MGWKLQKAKVCYLGALAFLITALCPIATWATPIGIVKMQDMIIEKAIECNSVEEKLYYERICESGMDLKFSSKTLAAVKPKGRTDIEESLAVGKSVITDGGYLEKGTKVHLYLIGNSDAKFKAGILDSDGKLRYVNSSNGEIDYTFTVQTSGNYRIYIENSGTVDIDVSGTVYIK